MITHKFREVMAFADEVTILRRGRAVGRGRVAELTPDEMARSMIGAEELTPSPARSGEFGPARLEIDRLAALDDAGQPAVRGLILAVRAGEIVGVAGVSGNGQRELVEVLAGQRQAEAAPSASPAMPITARARRCAATTSPACRRSRCRTPASRA